MFDYLAEFGEAANTTNRWYVVGNRVENCGQLTVRPNNTVTAELRDTGANVTAGLFTKIAASIKVNDFALSQDARPVLTASSGYLPNNIDKLYIGASGVGVTLLNGHIKSIKYYPRRLSNAQLQELTQ